jgi:hypothetical protein
MRPARQSAGQVDLSRVVNLQFDDDDSPGRPETKRLAAVPAGAVGWLAVSLVSRLD